MKRILCCLLVLSSLSFANSDSDDDDAVFSEHNPSSPCLRDTMEEVGANCPICFKLESELPNPASDLRVVCPCGQNICIHCLEQIIERTLYSKHYINCPYCRLETSIEELILRCNLRLIRLPRTLENIQRLTPDQIKSLTEHQIRNLHNNYIRSFLPEQTTWFTPEQMRYFTRIQIGYFTIPQLKVFSLEQLHALRPEQIRGLLPHQLDVIREKGLTVTDPPLPPAIKPQKTTCCCCW